MIYTDRTFYSNTKVKFKIKDNLPSKDKAEREQKLIEATRLAEKGLFLSSLHEVLEIKE